MENLKGKYVLITGASGGIGAATAQLLVQGGAIVFITGRNAAKLAATAAACGIPEERCVVANLAQAGDVEQMRQQYFAQLPAIDILINAAGTGIIKPVEQITVQDLERSLQDNLMAPFLLTKAFLPAMKEVKKGLIINIPGILGKTPMAGAAAYCASKYGLVGMMQSVREEVKRTEIRITNLFLGGTDSAFWDHIDLRVQRDKMILAQEAARAIWFLCQQPSSGVVNEMVLQPFNHQAI